eukprot:CAMPEP_0184700410 /NCGR_PEP_ID=MMETSP0313-20130426/13058_1 /TAXON_ID=2792 /ORGANISM="Porphyridium aerugineum, Strain SAG 1380-2" /LENGTH=226 /DNA_ID=CAMNT_0027160063 /DNA_START=38 /DNA_END=716 /DNA_ORIENTATION=-
MSIFTLCSFRSAVLGLLLLCFAGSLVSMASGQGILEDRISLFKQDLLKEGFSEQVIAERLAKLSGASVDDKGDAQPPAKRIDTDAVKSSLEGSMKKHYSSLDQLTKSITEEIRAQKVSIKDVDSALKKVQETLQQVASNSQKFQKDLVKMNDMVDTLHKMAEMMENNQNEVRHEMTKATSAVSDMVQKGSGYTMWYFVMLMEILVVVGYLYFRKSRQDKKYNNLVK